MNYQDLIKTALAYADKADADDVIANMDAFLRVVESRVNRALQTRLQSKRAQLWCSLDIEYYGLPPDYGGLRDVEIITGGDKRITLRYLAPEAMDHHITVNGTIPSFSVVANQLHIWPLFNSDNRIEIIYYQRVMPLTPDSPENWLTRYAFDVYLCGVLVELFAFIKDADGAGLWDQKFRSGLKELYDDDARDLWSGPSPSIQLL